MLDLNHIPKGRSDTQIFTGTSDVYGSNWQTWIKPRGKSMCNIILLGKGGNGGNTAASSPTLAAGGGGGSGGSLVCLVMPLSCLPDMLYLSLAGITTINSVHSCISIATNNTPNNLVAMSRGGGNGNVGSSGVGGTGGLAPGASSAADMPLGWQYTTLAVTGQAGAAGGGAQAAGGAIALPLTGAISTGGSGGGGIDSAAGTAGYAGGSITIPAGADFPAHRGGVAATSTAMIPGAGTSGYQIPGKLFFYGGTGSGSSYNAATGDGLLQAEAGNGSYGSGGGGLAAAQTGSVIPGIAMGGPALAIITCW